MNKLQLALVVTVLMAPGISFADQVLYATDEDLNSFDEMLASAVEIQAIPTENTQKVEINTEFVKQRGGYGLVISDQARQQAPQRSVAPSDTGATLRGTAK